MCITLGLHSWTALLDGTLGRHSRTALLDVTLDVSHVSLDLEKWQSTQNEALLDTKTICIKFDIGENVCQRQFNLNRDMSEGKQLWLQAA